MRSRELQIPGAALGLLGGAYSLASIPELPPVVCLPWFILAALTTLGLPGTRLAGMFLCGFVLMWLGVVGGLNNRLDPGLAGQDLIVTGEISSFPATAGDGIRFEFEPLGQPEIPRKLRLSWYDAEYLPAIGEVWQLHLRLRRPRGLSNPHGFDLEGWLFRSKIGATGYVVSIGNNRRLLSRPAGYPDAYRQRFTRRVSDQFPANRAAGVMLAVAVGARHGIVASDWDLYAATGTSHLMAVSGLHIGLAAGSAFLLVWFLAAPFCQRVNARDLATLAAMSAACLYASLSGFAIPAKRAFLMAAILAMVVIARRRPGGITILALVAGLVFLADPLSILAPGFMLSFAAVAVLQAGLSRYSGREQAPAADKFGVIFSSARKLWHLQIGLLLGLFPLTVILFDRFAPVAPFVNMLVLPVFSFITVPFCLAGMLLAGPLEPVGNLLLIIAYQSVRLIIWLVEGAASIPGSGVRTTALSIWLKAAACLPAICAFMPAGWPGRRVGFIAVTAVVLYKPAAPPQSCFDYTVLDVGQGLAAIVRTNSKVLLFDTGPSSRSGTDTVERVVLPYFHRLGIRRIEKVVVSHADNDHSGGLATLLASRSVAVGSVTIGEDMGAVASFSQACRAGSRWTWDGVEFEFLHPKNRDAWLGNNRSCVLLVSVSGQALLLTGDIEAPVEQLLAYRQELPAVSHVIVPHHGSATSSSEYLVAALQPDIAIVSAAHVNRWGLPKPSVVSRWQKSGANVLNTATSGAIRQRLCAAEAPGHLQRSRIDSPRHWRDTARDRG